MLDPRGQKGGLLVVPILNLLPLLNKGGGELTTSFLRSRFPRMKPPRRHHKAFDREDFVFGGYKDVFLLQDSWIGHQSSLSSCIQSLHGLFKVNSKFMLRRLDRQTGRSMLVSGLKAEAYVKEVLCNVIIAPRSKRRLPFR